MRRENSFSRLRGTAPEIAKARNREVQEKRQVLFPVRLVDYPTLQAWKCFDADIGKDSAQEIRAYFIPDFSTWKDHDAYQGIGNDPGNILTQGLLADERLLNPPVTESISF